MTAEITELASKRFLGLYLCIIIAHGLMLITTQEDVFFIDVQGSKPFASFATKFKQQAQPRLSGLNIPLQLVEYLKLVAE
jgi:mannose/fructose-specific phosphotransferase system component IIA